VHTTAPFKPNIRTYDHFPSVEDIYNAVSRGKPSYIQFEDSRDIMIRINPNGGWGYVRCK